MPGPPKQFDRDEALRRATAVFWERGYDGTSVEHLLEAMALSRSSMYATFGDKKALFLESLRSWIDEAITAFRSALDRPGPVFDRIISGLEEKQRMQLEHGNLGCFFGNTLAEVGMRDPDVAPVLASFMERVERVLVSTLDAAVRDGKLAGDTDTRAMALFIVTFAQGAALLSVSRPDGFGELRPMLSRLLSSGAFERR